ncbi:MAG: LEA type 2 family protein [Thaumarchaeota archaeon]|nr:LEA type 2 family protein [Nitrososphaerota archaeon]
MGKKKAIIIVPIILVILYFGFQFFQQEVSQREALKDVEISLDGVNVNSVGFTSATLELRFRMYNPNAVTATLDRADYEVYGNDISLGNGNISQRIDIQSRETRTVTTIFDASYGGAASVLISAIREGNVNWRIGGTAYYDTPLGSITVPFIVDI